MREQKNVNTIIKAADILKCITKGINQSSSIADNLGLSRSTTHRLLKTLQAAEHGDFQKAKFNLDSNAAIYWHAINPQPYVVLAAVQAAREWEDRNK